MLYLVDGSHLAGGEGKIERTEVVLELLHVASTNNGRRDTLRKLPVDGYLRWRAFVLRGNIRHCIDNGPIAISLEPAAGSIRTQCVLLRN